MAQVNVTVAGKNYRMSCGDGEEEHLAQLAQTLDAKIAGLREAFGDIGEMRLQVMAALYFADEAGDLKERLAQMEARMGAIQQTVDQQSSAAQADLARVAQAMESVAARIEAAAKAIG